MMTLFEVFSYASVLLDECKQHLAIADSYTNGDDVRRELTGASDDLAAFFLVYEYEMVTKTFPNVDRLWFTGFLACQEALASFDALHSAPGDDSAGQAA